MKSSEVIELYNNLKNNNIDIWLDGGWGVDALLKKQTREHNDVDIVIQQKDVDAFIHLLAEKGYRMIQNEDKTDWNFVLEDDHDHRIDTHVIVFDEKGNGIYGPLERGVQYPAYAFEGEGTVDGQTVRCLTAEYQVVSHTGYKIDENDRRDVKALCERFNIDYPKEYL